MGLTHEAKRGTIIQANGVTVTVLRGSPHLEITTEDPEVVITTTDPQSASLTRCQANAEAMMEFDS